MAPKVTINGNNGNGIRGDEQCPVSEQRGGVVYRCGKRKGHEHDPLDAEHEAQAPEYAYRPPDWRAMFEAALPILEWVAAHPQIGAGDMRADMAKRLLVRHYISATTRPGLAKTRPAP